MVFHQPIWKICNSQIGAHETPRFGVKINMFETTTYLDNKTTSPAALWNAIMKPVYFLQTHQATHIRGMLSWRIEILSQRMNA